MYFISNFSEYIKINNKITSVAPPKRLHRSTNPYIVMHCLAPVKILLMSGGRFS